MAAFALAAGVLVWRTGGIEAAIALHVVNNSLVFAFGAVGWLDLNFPESTILDTLASTTAILAVCTVLILWVERKARRSRSAKSQR